MTLDLLFVGLFWSESISKLWIVTWPPKLTVRCWFSGILQRFCNVVPNLVCTVRRIERKWSSNLWLLCSTQRLFLFLQSALFENMLLFGMFNIYPALIRGIENLTRAINFKLELEMFEFYHNKVYFRLQNFITTSRNLQWWNRTISASCGKLW